MNWVPRSIYGNGTIEKRVLPGVGVWNGLPRLLSSFDFSKPLSCTIQAVLEPNKVRIISKGQALPYYSQKPLQKAIHGALRNMNCFRLIGRPLCPTDIMDCAAKAQPDWKWFSVDYSAATDGLSWRYSGKIFEYIIQDLAPEDRVIAMSVLGPHKLFYPCTEEESACAKEPTLPGTPLYKGTMTNGQLMGSILSFPILCLANLGLYLLSTSVMTESWSHQERLDHVLINGDDMVYSAPSYVWPIHVGFGESVGLNMSVGKAYRHHTYLNINSTSIHYDLRTPKLSRFSKLYSPSQPGTGAPEQCIAQRLPTTPWQIDYLNVGLYLGRHKVQDKDHGQAPTNIGLASEYNRKDDFVCNINLLMQGSLPSRQTSLMRMILAENSERIRQECRVSYMSNLFDGKRREHIRNLFLPTQLGGMGVISPGRRNDSPDKRWIYRITPTDKHFALQLLCNRTDFRSIPFSHTRPLEGYEILEQDSVGTQPWVRDEIKENLHEVSNPLNVDISSLRYRGYLTGAIYLQSCSNFDVLYKAPNSSYNESGNFMMNEYYSSFAERFPESLPSKKEILSPEFIPNFASRDPYSHKLPISRLEDRDVVEKDPLLAEGLPARLETIWDVKPSPPMSDFEIEILRKYYPPYSPLNDCRSVESKGTFDYYSNFDYTHHSRGLLLCV